MHKEARTLITAASGALCLASLFLHLWLFDKYFNSLPHQPQPQFGRVRPLNNHGSYVYLTDAEATGLSFLTLAFFVGFLIAIVMPKRYVPGKGTEQELGTVTNKQFTVVFLIAISLYLAIIAVAGPRIVGFATSHGLVATWGI